MSVAQRGIDGPLAGDDVLIKRCLLKAVTRRRVTRRVVALQIDISAWGDEFDLAAHRADIFQNSVNWVAKDGPQSSRCGRYRSVLQHLKKARDAMLRCGALSQSIDAMKRRRAATKGCVSEGYLNDDIAGLRSPGTSLRAATNHCPSRSDARSDRFSGRSPSAGRRRAGCSCRRRRAR
jgi:hypothetical protein